MLAAYVGGFKRTVHANIADKGIGVNTYIRICRGTEHAYRGQVQQPETTLLHQSYLKQSLHAALSSHTLSAGRPSLQRTISTGMLTCQKSMPGMI